VYKTRIHEIIWFPYRPEMKVIGPLLALLFIGVAATGIASSVNLFTSFTANSASNLAPWTVALVLVVCLVVCVFFARMDYISVYAALLPCFVTTLAIVVLSLYSTSPKLDTKSLLQAAAGALASLLFTGRVIQSGGVDLGKLGATCRRTKRKARLCLQTSAAESSFANRREELVQDVRELTDDLKKAASETVDQASAETVIKSLQDFLDRSALVDHADFLRDVGEGPKSLIETLKLVGKRRDHGT
jgi:hypothetical protein